MSANGDPILISSREGEVPVNEAKRGQVPGLHGKRKGKLIAKEM